MRPPLDSPALRRKSGEELSLSGAALLALMREVLSRGVPFRFRAKGWSMSPFIRDRDVITLSPLGDGLPVPGDVVAFVHPLSGKPAVHRVIGRTGDAFLIRGDNIPEGPDGVIPREKILGRVTRVERAGKPVRLGLGPGRFLVASLSRIGLLLAAKTLAGPLLRPFLGKRR